MSRRGWPCRGGGTGEGQGRKPSRSRSSRAPACTGCLGAKVAKSLEHLEAKFPKSHDCFKTKFAKSLDYFKAKFPKSRDCFKAKFPKSLRRSIFAGPSLQENPGSSAGLRPFLQAALAPSSPSIPPRLVWDFPSFLANRRQLKSARIRGINFSYRRFRGVSSQRLIFHYLNECKGIGEKKSKLNEPYLVKKLD